jgi:phosphopantothenoylcysteine decarboxylase/phosphopantothenate--cysteine ligase
MRATDAGLPTVIDWSPLRQIVAPVPCPSTLSTLHSSPRILITAGPTHEPIDAVRYLSNRSSGRMGVALAEASLQRHWATTLLLGPTSLAAPESSHLRLRRFQTTDDLQRLLAEEWPRHDVLLMAAAVADYRPSSSLEGPGKANQKIPRRAKSWTLELEPTPDLLADLSASSRADQVLIGFALEPADQLRDSARKKLQAKKLHAIVANPLETMDSPTIDATILFADGTIHGANRTMAKSEFASWMLDAVSRLWQSHQPMGPETSQGAAHGE